MSSLANQDWLKGRGVWIKYPQQTPCLLFPTPNQPAMSSNNASSSSNVYNFTPGDWTWGAMDPSKNWEVKLNTPCLGYHPLADTNEDNVLLQMDQSYDDHQDVVPLPGKMEYPSFSEVGMVANSMIKL